MVDVQSGRTRTGAITRSGRGRVRRGGGSGTSSGSGFLGFRRQLAEMSAIPVKWDGVVRWLSGGAAAGSRKESVFEETAGGGAARPWSARRAAATDAALSTPGFTSAMPIWTGDDNSLERRLYYNADAGRPSFERQQEMNREYVRVATPDM
jgi:hypothetical protein